MPSIAALLMAWHCTRSHALQARWRILALHTCWQGMQQLISAAVCLRPSSRQIALQCLGSSPLPLRSQALCIQRQV